MEAIVNDSQPTPDPDAEVQQAQLTEQEVLAAQTLEQSALVRAQNEHLLKRVVVLRALVLNQKARITELENEKLAVQVQHTPPENSPEENLVGSNDD